MRERDLLLSLILTLFLGACARVAHGAGSNESWYAITFHGSKVGHVRAREARVDLEGRPAVHVERWSVITVKRQAEVIRMEHALDVWFTPEGDPLRYSLRRQEGSEVRTGEGYKDGSKFVVRHTVGGRAKDRSFDLRPGDRLASSLEWLYLRAPEPGRSVEGRAIDETEGDIQPFTVRVGKLRASRDPGRAERVFGVRETLGGVESVLEVSPKDGLVRSELEGAGIVMFKTSKAEALRLDEAVDIFSAALFPVRGVELPPRDRIEALTTRFTSEKGVSPRIRNYPRQSLRKLDGGQVEVYTEAAPVPTTGGRLPLQGARVAGFLTSTDYEDLEDERLRETAHREVGDAADAWSAARRINRFVHRHLENKTLAHAFASATEALRERSGDCTEHAVLFSALAKIVGIPTKLVTGLVFVGGRNPAFGYHEWVEVWLGDRWHPMDPTFGQDVADPTHIKFSEGISDPAGLRDAGLAAASLIGDVNVEVLSYVRGGKTVKVTQP